MSTEREGEWVLEDKTIVNDTLTRIFSAEHYKTYRIYEKQLTLPHGAV